MSLRTRLTIALAGLVLLLALCGAAGAMLLSRADDARDKHDVHLTELLRTEQLRGSFRSHAASLRAFLETGEESYLIENSGQAEESRLIQELRSSDLTATETAHLDRLVDRAERWQDEAVDPLVTLRRTGGPGLVAARAAEIDSFDGIEAELDAFEREVSLQAAGSEADASRARRDVARLASGSLLLAVSLMAAAAIAGHCWITGPLLRLGSSVRDIQAGDLTTVITSFGPPEIAALGDEIERMRRRLGVELEATLRSQEGLVQNAAVLMSVRSRLESTPELMPSGWSVAASLTPATGVVAGDCYDVAWVQQSRLGVVVVDVAGHGAEPAVVALRAKELLRAAIRTYVDLGEAVRWACRQLDGLAPDMFVTAFIAVLDTGTGLIEYVGAGHPPALLCGADGVDELTSNGPIIGPFEAVWASGRTTIEPGQTLLVYTDGLTEVRDHERVEFGIDRLRALACAEFDDADALIKRCLEDTAAFSTIRGQDDVTIVAVCRSDV